MNLSTWHLVLQASFIVKVILILLAGFSVFSWTLIVQKYLSLRQARRQTRELLTAYEQGPSLSALKDAASAAPHSPLSGLVVAATERRRSPASTERVIAAAATAERERLQSGLTFLATTGSSSPFIGLLGTVWGIMDAFRGIGASGSASLAVLSPAIAEALITTAAGLLAAIPAVMAYNAFLAEIRRISGQLDDFGDMLQDQLKESAGHETRLAERARV